MTGALRFAAGCVLCGMLTATAATGATPGAASVRYWKTSELDTRPQIKTQVMPEYPRDLPSGVRGRVVLDLYVSELGVVENIKIVRAEPAGRFEDAAARAFWPARFTPGLRKGKPVPSRVRIEVSFGD